MELSYVAYLDDEKAEEKLETPFTFEAQVIWESVEPDEVIPGVSCISYHYITGTKILVLWLVESRSLF